MNYPKYIYLDNSKDIAFSQEWVVDFAEDGTLIGVEILNKFKKKNRKRLSFCRRLRCIYYCILRRLCRRRPKVGKLSSIEIDVSRIE